MRELNLNEVSYISGGLNCIDGATFQKIHSQAINKGIVLGLLGTTITGGLGFGIGQYALAGVLGSAVAGSLVGMTGAIVVTGPALFAYGYFTASSWDLIS